MLLGQSACDRALAEHLAFTQFAEADGLSSLGGACMIQDRAGHVLVCSEHGVFAFDGRRFVDLGPAQGLRNGGIVYDLELTGEGRIAVRYADQLLISDVASIDRPPTRLSFRAVILPKGLSFYSEFPFQLAPWRGGFAAVVDHHTMRVVIPPRGGRPYFAPIPYDATEAKAVYGPTAVFSIRNQLWETFDDGRVCAADPGFVRCYGAEQGLTGGPWMDVTAGSDGKILARSAATLATIDPVSGDVREDVLPDQGGLYKGYPRQLQLFRTPSGQLMTQSADGLIVRRPTGWAEMTSRDGIPPGVVDSEMSDRDGELWLKIFGSGVFRALGYGHLESLGKDSDFPAGVAWQTARARDGSLWVSTDVGLDRIRRVDGMLRVVKAVPIASFALAVGPDGRIWSSAGQTDICVIDPKTLVPVEVPTPNVNSITVGSDGRVWLGTDKGLFLVDVPLGGSPVIARDGSSSGYVAGTSSDESGGVWVLSRGRLWHRHANGTLALVSGDWPSGGFEPAVIASTPDRRLWIGGTGGLYGLTLSGDRVVSLQAVSPPDILSNSVPAVMVDHRGWLWVGTGLGVSVYNGSRWVSLNTDGGLVGNDVSQGGLREDPDGSVWIATSQGVSHLLDPAWLFAERPMRVVIAEATLGATTLPARHIPFSVAPLDLQFGTFDYASERAIVFRYRMEGVDQGWAETSTGSVRYPFVPPGRHVLTVVGYNTLTHAVSTPATLTIDMAYPWWRQWWAYALYAVVAMSALRCALMWREREAQFKRRKLERLVEERTRDMQFAQAELKRQATLDSLTGLLNRGEVQRRLADNLASREGTREIVVAMVDLDHFKRINDEHGHLAGDDVLQALGVRISAILHSQEYAGRYGGEEFIVVLDDTDGQGARRILVLHQAVRQAPFYVDEAEIPVTCSIGAAWATTGDTWKTLIRRADAALYEAKHSGRDRIVESREDQALDPPTSTG